MWQSDIAAIVEYSLIDDQNWIPIKSHVFCRLFCIKFPGETDYNGVR